MIYLLSEKLRHAVTMQGDVICHQGMVGHEMWFIETGIVTVHVLAERKGCSAAPQDGAAAKDNEQQIGGLSARGRCSWQ